MRPLGSPSWPTLRRTGRTGRYEGRTAAGDRVSVRRGPAGWAGWLVDGPGAGSLVGEWPTLSAASRALPGPPGAQAGFFDDAAN